MRHWTPGGAQIRLRRLDWRAAYEPVAVTSRILAGHFIDMSVTRASKAARNKQRHAREGMSQNLIMSLRVSVV